jgi:flagellin
MALSVATNTGALMAQAAARSVNKEMETSMERLATGKRINGAADDAAGVAISSRLTSEIRGTNQAIRNAMDSQAMVDTAEGAHEEITNILQRMREIAVQAANDTNDATDRNNLSAEVKQLATEIDRIAQVTTWAGKTLLNGTSGTGNASFNFHVGSRTGAADTISHSIDSMRKAALGISGDTSANATDQSANITLTSNNSDTTKLTVASLAADTSGTGTVKLDGFEASVAIASGTTATAITASLKTAIDALDGYSATISTDINLIITKVEKYHLSTTTEATTLINTLDTAINTVNTQRAALGSISNRLDNTVSNLTNMSSNLQAGRGRIEDADFAAETTNLARTQILQQASTAMLAQANASKQNVLSLLQG